MILLDTNVIIDMLNNQNDENWDLFQSQDISICGIVTAELYRGIRNKKEEKAVSLFVNSIDSIPINESDWKEIGLFIAGLKQSGLTVPFQDAVIAYIAIKSKCMLLSHDKHFKLIQTVDERLELYETFANQSV